MAHATLTIRVPPELADRLRSTAAQRGESLNAYATAVLGAAVDPELAGTELERVRERLARAGLLAPASGTAKPPDAERVARARRAASQGRRLSDLVAENRGA
jgi:plasmid stability protein